MPKIKDVPKVDRSREKLLKKGVNDSEFKDNVWITINIKTMRY